jgi:hypothetical protein
MNRRGGGYRRIKKFFFCSENSNGIRGYMMGMGGMVRREGGEYNMG